MSDEDEGVRALLEDAGPRTPLPEEDLAAIREAAREEWRGRYGDGRARPKVVRWWWLAAAAAVLVGAAALLWPRRPSASWPVPAGSAARIERLAGIVLLSGKDGKPTALSVDAVGRAIPLGASVETYGSAAEPGRLTLRMAGGASVRLDSTTQARLASPAEVELERGGVYVDTGAPGKAGEDVAVRTAAGLFQSVGTQFEVRAEGGGTTTRLKVRQGRVRLERGAGSVTAGAGEELVVKGDGTLERGTTAADGPEWNWALASAPMPDIEGMKVRDFLEWLAHERGWEVELADSETKALVDSVVLHGSIAHLTPAEAPDVVLPSGGFGYRVNGRKLVVFAAGREPVRTPR